MLELFLFCTCMGALWHLNDWHLILCIISVFYADDIVLWSGSLQNLQHMIDICVNSSRLGPVQGFSFYDYSKADWAHFALDLKSFNWSAFFMNCISIIDYWLRWLYLIRMLIEKYVPYKTLKSRANQRSKLPARLEIS
jgi:hypothetical protein